MPRKDKGFTKLNHENIELNTFHDSQSDDDGDDMRVIGEPSDCLCCPSRSRWNIVMTVTLLGLLCSSVVLFMYFAYRDSMMTGRLKELEARLDEITSTGNNQPSVAGLVVRMDSIAKQLDDNTKMLMQSVDQVNINCHNTVNNQTQFINNKTVLLDVALKQIRQTQLSVNSTMKLLASVRATVDGYIQTKADLVKDMGDLKNIVDKSQESMEQMRSDMASHQAELKNLEGAVHNYTEQLTNTSLYCHQHVDQLHLLLANMNTSMATEMSTMWKNMLLNSSTPTNVTSKPLDTVGYLLADPVFLSNISLKIASMINSNLSHNDVPMMKSPIVSQLSENLTKLQEMVGLMGEDVQQINYTLQTVQLFVSEHLYPVHTNMTTNTTTEPSGSIVASSTANVRPSSVMILTSSENMTSVVVNGSPALQSAVSTNFSVSNSLEQTSTATNTASLSMPSNTSSSVVKTLSSSFTTTVIIPSPVTSSTETAMERTNSTSIVVLSTGKISVESSLSVNATVTSSPTAAAVDNKTLTLENGIHAFEKFLENFETLDVNKDDRLSINETKFAKVTFDKIDTNGDSYITVDELKNEITHLEDKLNALKMPVSTNVDDSYSVGLSSRVHFMTTTSQPVISSTVVATSPVIVASSTAVIASSSAQSTLTKASPSSSTSSELDEIMNDLAEATKDLA